MTTARQILEDALSFHLNRLSPGESADADTLAVGLRALNNIVDEWNGTKSLLFRTAMTASAAPITTATGTFGSTWVGINPGDDILGATYSLDGLDFQMDQLTMRQYHEQIPDKTQVGEPEFWAHDGLATVYMYPVPNSKTITLRTRAPVTELADIDTDYSMPNGYRAALSICVAEMLALTMLGSVPQVLTVKAVAARNRIAAQVCEPEIIGRTPMRNSIIQGY